MKVRSSGQLKAFIKSKAAEKGIRPYLLMQYYMLERLLERISLSPYWHNFVLKGGLLVSAMVGLNSRTTMDMDITVQGFSLTHEELLSIFEEICDIQTEDNIRFEITGLSDIRESDDYPGIRISLKAICSTTVVPLTIDVTTGDVITPCKMEYRFPLLFDDSSIGIFAYTLETVLAEKLEAILTRNTRSTRMRDFYDVYILYTLYDLKIDKSVLRLALERTSEKRNSDEILTDYPRIMEKIRDGNELRERWDNYRLESKHAEDTSFEDVCNVIQRLMDLIMS